MTTLTTDAIFEGQRFAILAMFFLQPKDLFHGKKERKQIINCFLLHQNPFPSSIKYFFHRKEKKLFHVQTFVVNFFSSPTHFVHHDVFIDMVLVNNHVCLFLVLSLAVFTTASCYLDITNILLIVPTLGRFAGATVL